MANNRFVHQSVYNISVNREKIVSIACNDQMNRKDYKVFLMLLSQLTGYKATDTESRRNPDPLNFKRVDVKQIAESLDMKRKDVDESIDKLFVFEYLEEGTNDSVVDGWRFTF